MSELRFTPQQVANFHPDVAHFLNIMDSGDGVGGRCVMPDGDSGNINFCDIL